MSRMTIRLIRLLLGVTLTATAALSQEIQNLDPALDQLVPPNAKLERVATGFEGCGKKQNQDRRRSTHPLILPDPPATRPDNGS